MTLRYASICLGIGTCRLASAPLGWECAFFAEIDPFASAVLATHYPEVPNLGDFTAISAAAGPVDLLVGGTPCQSFSVAGKRAGLDDPRGNLAIEFARLAARLRARWVFWENVPGVVSSWSDAEAGDDDGVWQSNDLDTFLGILEECGYQSAWRILDAQFAGVPQRRRRVFVVGHLGDWRPSAAVLFDAPSLRWHPAPGRAAGEGSAPEPAGCLGGGSGARGWADDTDRMSFVAGTLQGWSGQCQVDSPYVTDGAERVLANTLRANPDSFGGQLGSAALAIQEDNQNGVLVSDTAGSLRADAPGHQPCGTLVASALRGESFDAGGDGSTGGAPLVVHSLRADGFDASEDGTGRGTPIIAESVACLTGSGFRDAGGHEPASIPPVSFNWQSGGDCRIDPPSDQSGNLQSSQVPAVAVSLRGREGDATAELGGEAASALRSSQGGGDKAYVLAVSANQRGEARERAVDGSLAATKSGKQFDGIVQAMQVRRLTPLECERLQGLPDNWTLVPYAPLGRRKDPTRLASDGPRYRAIGNSWALPDVAWIFARIDAMERRLRDPRTNHGNEPQENAP